MAHEKLDWNVPFEYFEYPLSTHSVLIQKERCDDAHARRRPTNEEHPLQSRYHTVSVSGPENPRADAVVCVCVCVCVCVRVCVCV